MEVLDPLNVLLVKGKFLKSTQLALIVLGALPNQVQRNCRVKGPWLSEIHEDAHDA